MGFRAAYERCAARPSSSERKGTGVQHQLDHEKLDVYRIELEFIAWATDLMVELRGAAR